MTADPGRAAEDSFAAERGLLPISVIIPAFGRHQLLMRAIRSIVDQSRPPMEIIVVDDGSAPGLSLDDVPHGRVRTEIVRHDTNRGAAAARNTGVRHAKAEWVTFLDSDDYLLPDSLSARWQALTARGSQPSAESAIFGCGWSDFDEQGRILRTVLPRPGPGINEMASGCWYSPGSCILVRRAAFDDGAIWQDEDLSRFEDYDWSLRLGLNGFSLKVLPVVGAAIRRHRTQEPERIEQVTRRIVEKWRSRDLNGDLMRKVEAYMALECAAAHYHRGGLVQTIRYLARSFRAVPRLRLHLSPGWEEAVDLQSEVGAIPRRQQE